MRPAAIATLLLLWAGPLAAEPRPAAELCDRGKLAGRSYIECLEAALREADRTLVEALRKAQADVDSRADLATTQRTRWKNVLEESQGLFVRYRNFDCQNVAPYEGGTRIGAFEERIACLIDKNVARSRELLRRYGKQ